MTFINTRNKTVAVVSKQHRQTQQNPNIVTKEHREVYLVLTCILNQNSTNDPEVEMLANSFYGDIVFSRTGVGNYTISFQGNFPEGRTIFIAGTPSMGTGARVLMANRIDKDTIQLRTTIDGKYSDDALTDTALEIRVYL